MSLSVAEKPALTRCAHTLSHHESLWKRVPTHTEDGQPVCDFMLLIPGLNKRLAPQIEKRIEHISLVLREYEPWVLFADLNLKLNILWISYRPRMGLSFEIAGAIRSQVPETRIIAIKLE